MKGKWCHHRCLSYSPNVSCDVDLYIYSSLGALYQWMKYRLDWKLWSILLKVTCELHICGPGGRQDKIFLYSILVRSCSKKKYTFQICSWKLWRKVICGKSVQYGTQESRHYPQRHFCCETAQSRGIGNPFIEHIRVPALKPDAFNRPKLGISSWRVICRRKAQLVCSPSTWNLLPSFTYLA